MPTWSSRNAEFTGVGGGPGRLTQRQYNQLRRLDTERAGVQRKIRAEAEFAMLKGMQEAIASTDRVVSEELSNITRLVSQMSPAKRTQIHREVGLAAQRSVRAAYSNRRHRKRTPSYRISANSQRNQRYAGGALLRVIGASDFFEATPSGLKFINTTRLNKEAKQWRRLNFGAGGRATTPPGRYSVSWDGLVVATMGLEPDPRPAFRIPRGYWFAGGQRVGAGMGTEFYPVGEQPSGTRGRPSPARMTKGIAASNFLDAGVQRIAREMPRAYTRAVQELINRDIANYNRITQKSVAAPVIRAPRIRLGRI
jgi:hypothetical protein